MDTTTGLLFTGDLTVQPPPNSTFVNGWLVSNDDAHDVCAGVGDPTLFPDDGSISLCQALAYSAGEGNLSFFLVSIPVIHCLTLPAIFTLFGLPFRYYLVAIAAPMIGLVCNVFFAQRELAHVMQIGNALIEQSTDLTLGNTTLTASSFAIDGGLIFFACIAFALSSERYNRQLFTVQSALSDQREALLSERASTRFDLRRGSDP